MNSHVWFKALTHSSNQYFPNFWFVHRTVYVTKKFELEIKVFCSESSELATDLGFGVSVCILLLSAVNCRLCPPTSQGSRDSSQGGRLSIQCLVHHVAVNVGLEKEENRQRVKQRTASCPWGGRKETEVA